MYKENYDMESVNFDKLLKLGQKYNVNGLIAPFQIPLKVLLKIIRTIPRISWIEAASSDRQYSYRHDKKKDDPFVANSVTHFNAALDAKISLPEIAKYLPNLTTLYYKNGVKLEDLQKMQERFDKLKVLRVGVPRNTFRGKIRNKKKVDPTSQLIELIHAFKKIAPNLEVLYMFYPLPRGQPAVALDREFTALEDTAKKIGVRLICRDLMQIMNPVFCEDPQGKFFLKSFKQNGLPYYAYTADETSLLTHAIMHLNVPVVKKLFAKKLTNLQYELTVPCETSRVSFSEYPLLAYQVREGRFRVEYLLPEATGAKTDQIVELLREKGYDLNTKLYLRYTKKLVETPVWSELNFSFSSVRRMFTNYALPIQWFTKGRKGRTLAHKLVTSRGTTVFLDLMEQQLSKEEISNLMSVQDSDGNTPVHLFSDASVATIDRLLPYVKHCWTIRNDKNENPLQHYIKRCKKTSIDIKEPKLRRIMSETPELDSGVVYSLFEASTAEVLTQVIPLLAEKHANFNESGALGRAFFLKQKLPLLAALKSVGVNLTEIDENGNNIIHGMFLTLTEYGKFSIDMEALKFAIKEGANVNQINKAGETPLFKAINSRLKNAEEVIKVLVEHGADPNIHGDDQITPLLHACTGTKKYDEFIKTLLDSGAKPFSVCTSKGYFNALVSSIHSASTKRLKLLIQHGADIKEQDDAGNSILHAFFSHSSTANDVKREKVLDFLLNYIDINVKNFNGDTPLHCAKALEVVGMAISRGADINARNNFGDTPIHSRKERYDPDEEVLDLFVRNTKIDWTAVGSRKVTLLHYLCHYPVSFYIFLTEVLPSKSPEEQQKIKQAFATHDEFCENALYEAVQEQPFDTIKACVETIGISPAWKSHQTPLHWLSASDKSSTFTMTVINYLLDHGADVNAQEYDLGNTSLHLALKVGSTELVKLYLERGANPSIKNKAGISPLDIAPDLLTRYKGSGMRWHKHRTAPPPEMSKIMKAFKEEQREKGRDEERSVDEGSEDELVNSDNENDDGPNYNEVDENDLEADFDEDMGSQDDEEDEFSGSGDEDEDNEEDVSDEDAMDVY
jgi:ankyrin repeat protein